MNFDDVLWYDNLVMEAALLGLLFYRRSCLGFSAFCLYAFWSLAADTGVLIIDTHFHSQYMIAYMIDLVVSFVLEFCVLAELAWSIFRPYRSLLPRAAPLAPAGFILLIGGAIWPFTGNPRLLQTPMLFHVLIRLQQDSAVLRVLFFLVLAVFCQVLSIGWRDRELQIATGLGFYSLISVLVEIVQSRLVVGLLYIHLNRIVVCAYACSLVYWVFSFARKEPERRPFTPQMQSLLFAVAGTARSTRAALSGPGKET